MRSLNEIIARPTCLVYSGVILMCLAKIMFLWFTKCVGQSTWVFCVYPLIVSLIIHLRKRQTRRVKMMCEKCVGMCIRPYHLITRVHSETLLLWLYEVKTTNTTCDRLNEQVDCLITTTQCNCLIFIDHKRTTKTWYPWHTKNIMFVAHLLSRSTYFNKAVLHPHIAKHYTLLDITLAIQFLDSNRNYS